MKLLPVICFTLLFARTFSNPEKQSSLSRSKRFWNLAPEPNYEPEAPVNPVQRPIGWLIPPDTPQPQPTRRRTTTAKPTHGVAYQIVKAVVHAGASNVIKSLSSTTQRPVRRTTVRQSQLKRRIRTSTTTTTEIPIQSSSVATSAFQNPAGDDNSVLVPVTTYGQDGKPTVVYMFVPKDRILGYQKEGSSSSIGVVQ